MTSKNKNILLDELADLYDIEKSEDKRQLLSTLYDKIEGLDDDNDIQNLLWANSEVPLSSFTNEDLKAMPNVARLLTTSQPITDSIDYAKEFGENWYNDYEKIPASKIQYIADKHGRDATELINDMGREATKRRRHDIAQDGNIVTNTITNLAAPRSVEDIERGESPSFGSIAGDVLSNALYAVPWARGAQAATKALPRLYRVLSNRFVQGGLSNATAPIATEVYDRAVYGDENPRGEFNWGEVGAGTGTNLVGGALMQGLVNRTRRVFPEVANKLKYLDEGKTTKEAADEMAQKYRKYKIAQADDPSIPQVERDFANEMKQLSSTDPQLYNLLISKNSIWDIAAQPGKSIEEKVKLWLAKNQNSPLKYSPLKYTLVTGEGDVFNTETAQGMLDVMRNIGGVTQPQMTIAKYNKDLIPSPVSTELMRNYDKLNIGQTELGQNGVKTLGELAKGEAIKNYLTNQLGNFQYERGKALTKLPLVGPEIQRYIDKGAEKEKKQKEIDDIMKKWEIRFGGR